MPVKCPPKKPPPPRQPRAREAKALGVQNAELHLEVVDLRANVAALTLQLQAFGATPLVVEPHAPVIVATGQATPLAVRRLCAGQWSPPGVRRWWAVVAPRCSARSLTPLPRHCCPPFAGQFANAIAWGAGAECLPPKDTNARYRNEVPVGIVQCSGGAAGVGAQSPPDSIPADDAPPPADHSAPPPDPEIKSEPPSEPTPRPDAEAPPKPEPQPEPQHTAEPEPQPPPDVQPNPEPAPEPEPEPQPDLPAATSATLTDSDTIVSEPSDATAGEEAPPPA